MDVPTSVKHCIHNDTASISYETHYDTTYMQGDYNTRCDTGETENVVLTDVNVNVEKCSAECPKMSILGMGLSPFPELYPSHLPRSLFLYRSLIFQVFAVF